MSVHAHFARVHAARALEMLSRAERGQPLHDCPESIGTHYQLAYFKATVQTLAHDIESLLKEKDECPQ